MKDLTGRQKEVVSFISQYINLHSYPPTIRDIADHFAISAKGAHDHLQALKRKGAIRQDGKRARTLELLRMGDDVGTAEFIEIPIVGTIAAGIPILSEENVDGTIRLHRSMLKRNQDYFVMHVRGDSMTGAGILDGDLAVIEQQSIVDNGVIAAVAVDDDGITLKRFYKEPSRLRLHAENPAYKTIYCKEARVLGRLFQIIRDY